MRRGSRRKPDQCGGRGTAAMPNWAVKRATRFSSSKRPASGRDWVDAQAPIWLLRARVAK